MRRASHLITTVFAMLVIGGGVLGYKIGSVGAAGGASVTWGADGSTEGFLNVATGSAVNIAKRTTETSATGDIQNFLFKVVIPSGAFQPTGTYKATIRFTVTDN